MSSSVNATIGALETLGHRRKISFYGSMTPNLRFNLCMVVIWALILCFQSFQLIYKQWWFSIAFLCTAVLEVIGYAGRTWSHYDTFLKKPFLMNMVCLTIAPVFTMGGIYYQVAKLMEVYGHQFSLIKSPMLYSYIFISCDIVSLAIQAAGGGAAGMESARGESVVKGDNIFVAGLSIQVASMFFFLVLWYYFMYSIFVMTRLKHLGLPKSKIWDNRIWKISQTEIDYMYPVKYKHIRLNPIRWTFHYFSLAITFATMVVFTRCCYRLAELSEGWRGNLIMHEWYFIILDALMMSLCAVTLTIFHPGYAFKGRTQRIPITKGKKNMNDIESNISHSEESESDLMKIHNDLDTDKEIFVPTITDSEQKKKFRMKMNWKFWSK